MSEVPLSVGGWSDKTSPLDTSIPETQLLVTHGLIRGRGWSLFIILKLSLGWFSPDETSLLDITSKRTYRLVLMENNDLKIFAVSCLRKYSSIAIFYFVDIELKSCSKWWIISTDINLKTSFSFLNGIQESYGWLSCLNDLLLSWFPCFFFISLLLFRIFVNFKR